MAGARGLRVVRLLALVLAVLSTAVLVAAGTARSTVLNQGYYQQVLDQEHAYHRLYDKVLVDPDFAPVTRDLLARVPVPEGIVTANLKTLLPPTTTRALANEQIGHAINYLRGRQDKVRLTVDMKPVFANVGGLAQTYLGDLIASVQKRDTANFPRFVAGLDDTLKDMLAGRRPDSVPPVHLDNRDVPKVAKVLLSPLSAHRRTELRPRVTHELQRGDMAGALATVGPFLLGGNGGAASKQLASITKDGRWNVVPDLERAGADLSVVKSARNFTRLALGLVQTLAVILGSAALLTLWLTGPRPIARRLRYLGAALAVGGGVAALSMLAVRGAAARLMVTPPAHWPYSLTSLVDDLQHAAAQRLFVVGLVAAGIPLLTGALLVASGLLWERAVRHGRIIPRYTRLRALTVGITAVSLAGAALAPVTAGGQVPRTCLGSSSLCSRHYDDVAFLATHNSMSTSTDDFLVPLQDPNITGQLNAGARALLLDTHTWERPDEVSDRLKFSDFTPATQKRLTHIVKQANPRRPGLWLCHAVCGGGAIPLVPTLKKIRSWMDANPGEVVTLILEDGISGKQTARAFRKAGLEDMLYTPDSDPKKPWPTLGSMVDSGHRLVVFAEKSDGPAPWYRNFYRYGMETPYAFNGPEDMSCQPNRGGRNKRLFLMNHFVTNGAGSRIDAGKVNTRRFVLDRAHRCERERGRPVNFVAVDYATIGEARGAVDTLNAER